LRDYYIMFCGMAQALDSVQKCVIIRSLIYPLWGTRMGFVARELI